MGFEICGAGIVLTNAPDMPVRPVLSGFYVDNLIMNCFEMPIE